MGAAGGSPVFSRKKCTFLSGPFLSFRHFPLFSVESAHSGVPFLAALQYSFGKSAHSLSFSIIFFHFLHFFIFFHSLSCSLIFFNFLSFSFIFHFLSFFFFMGAQNLFFCLDCLTISDESSSVKHHSFGPSRGGRGYPFGPSFFSRLFFHFCHFRFLF